MNEDDLKVILGEALYPLVSHEDIRVAKAAADLLEIRSNSDSLGLGPAEREALLTAFGTFNGGTWIGPCGKATTV